MLITIMININSFEFNVKYILQKFNYSQLHSSRAFQSVIDVFSFVKTD